MATNGNEKSVFVNSGAAFRFDGPMYPYDGHLTNAGLVGTLQTVFNGYVAPDSAPDDVWEQDGYEIGYTEAPYGTMPLVLELPRAEINYAELQSFVEGTILQPNVGVIRPFDSVDHINADSGGDIESVTNPAGGPGYLLYGRGLPVQMKQFFAAQNVNPTVSPKGVVGDNATDKSGVNTSWLQVGHVDEVFSESPDGTHLMVADPSLAWALLLWANELPQADGSSGANAPMLQDMRDRLIGTYIPLDGTTVGQVLNNSEGIDGDKNLEAYNMQVVMAANNLRAVESDVENAMGIAASSLPTTVPVPGQGNSNMGGLTQGGAFVSFLPSTNVTRTYRITFTDNTGDYTLTWQDAGKQVVPGGNGNTSKDEVFAPVNGAGSMAYAYILKSWWQGSPQNGDTFTYVANPGSAVVQMPVLFSYYIDDDGLTFGAGAFTPNFVNCLVNGSAVIAGQAFGPVVNWSGNGASDIFQDYASAAYRLAGLRNVIWVDARAYHNEDGFVHCATNIIRVVPGPKMWWEI